jgi:hypothetical protein
MIIYANNRSPKKLRKKKTAKRLAEYKDWLDNINKMTTNFSNGKKVNVKTTIQPAKKYIRETPNYPSLESSGGVATKPIKGDVYTGDAMIGIGTLHKSNAVPIFRKEEAEEQAKMRR